MNKLIIHPKDSTTRFLSRVYEGLDATVVTGGVSKDDLRRMVMDHDQVMMMGHGTGCGLLSVNQFDGCLGHIIDHTFTEALAEKDNSIFIWCNADLFVKRHNLKGFYTGMFVSETFEAIMHHVWSPKEDIDESNNTFASLVNRSITAPPEVMHDFVTEQYGQLAIHNKIAAYNNARLYAQ